MNPNTDDLKNENEDLTKESSRKFDPSATTLNLRHPFSEKTSPLSENRYTLLKELGEGGMGVVQLVRDELLGREVALKKLHIKNKTVQKKEKHLLWRLQREAEIMAVLEHPNIVPLYEMQSKDEGEVQFTMKKVEGKTLRYLLEHAIESSSEERKFIEILLKVCDGIRYAHSRGIIHRDLKPENIMIGNYGEVYILDWGIAKRIGGPISETSSALPKSQTDIYKTLGGIGTFGYMSPEQQKLASEVNEQSDIYALGKILRECYIKYSPWQELNLFQKSLRESQNKTESTKSVNKALEQKIPQEIKAIIKKATEKLPADRYDKIESFAIDIENYLKDVPVSAQEYRLDELLRKWAKRQRKPLMFLGGIVLLLILLWGFWKWENEKNYRVAQNEAVEKLKDTTLGKETHERKQREQKLKLFLQSLTAVNKALIYKPGKYESESFKINVLEKILPLCYEEEDYQLASFLIDDLQTLVHFPEKKETFSRQVEEKKLKLLKQHLAKLEIWEQKYKSTDPKNQIKTGERDDFIFEVSKMEEEEVLEKLLVYTEEGNKIFTSETNVSLLQKQFYQDIVKALRRVGNKKANERLRICLKTIWTHLVILEAKGEEKFLAELREGKTPDFIQQRIHDVLIQKGEKLDPEYYLQKHSENRWEYINSKQEILFTLEFSQGTQFLKVYDTHKKNNVEYLHWLKEIMIALLALNDETSIVLLMYINMDLETFSPVDPILGNFLQNVSIYTPKTAIEYAYKGIIENFKGNLDEAISCYTKAIQITPDFAFAYYNRGVIKQKKQNFEDSIEDLNEAIRLNPQFSEAYNARGNSKEKQENFEGAMADFTKALLLNPQFAEAYYNRGTLKLFQNDFDGALSDFNEAIRLNPQFVMAYENRGVAKSKKQDIEGAIEDHSQAILLDPQNSTAYSNRGNMKHLKKDLEGALEDFTQAIQINPQYASAYNGRGSLKYEKTDFDGAIEDFTQAITINPQFDLAYYNRGNSKQAKKNFEDALVDFTHAIRLNPKQEKYYHNRGVMKINKMDIDSAIVDFTHAITINPNEAKNYTSRGSAKYLKKDFNGAIEDYTQAITLDPKHIETYYNRGTVKHDLQNFQDAIEDYTEMIRLDPQNGMGYYSRGNSRMFIHDSDGAIDDFNKAILLNPQFAEIYNNRGLLKKERNDLEGAFSDFNEAIRLKPQFFEAYLNRGTIKQMNKNFEGAIHDFNEALRFNPQLAFAYYTRGFSKKESGNTLGAIEDLEKGLSLQINPEVQTFLIDLLKQQSREQFTKKNWKNAKETLLKLKKHLPSDDPQQKQIDQKIQQLEKLLESEEKK